MPGINDSNILPVLLRESVIPSVGRFLAYSDDKVHALFLDGITLTLNWNFSSLTEKRQVIIFQTEIYFLLFFICGNRTKKIKYHTISIYFLEYKICHEALLISLDFLAKIRKDDKKNHFYKDSYIEKD